MKTTDSFIRLSSILAICLVASACAPAPSESESAAETPAPPTFLLTERPSDPIAVGEARQSLQPGQEATLRGQIGGAVKPFFDGYAGFVLADTEVMFCDEMGDDDHCPSPWDACCEDPDKLKALRVSVQVVDETGQPVMADLKENTQLKELDHVVVTGTVSEQSTPVNMIFLARGVYQDEEPVL